MPLPPPVQLTLDLPFNEAMSREDFLIGKANAHAFTFIDCWPEWPANTVLLSGPAGAGKTHLAMIWAGKSGAQRHFAKNLRFELIEPWLATGALVLEGVDVAGLDEAALFHLLNSVRGGQASLMMTAERPLAGFSLQLPDLISRLRAAIPLEIGAPDDVLLRNVYLKQFSDRQIAIDPAVIEYLMGRVERSLSAVRPVVNLLDEAAFSQGRAITKRFIAEIIEF